MLLEGFIADIKDHGVLVVFYNNIRVRVNYTFLAKNKYRTYRFFIQLQGGHGTGKTGNLVLTFSRQGKHREFCFDTGKNSETQGKYFSVTQGKI